MPGREASRSARMEATADPPAHDKAIRSSTRDADKPGCSESSIHGKGKVKVAAIGCISVGPAETKRDYR